MADRGPRIEDVKLFSSVADLPTRLWEALESRPPQEAAAGAGAAYDPDKGFTLKFMNGDYLVDTRARTITGPPDHRPTGFQKGLVLLTYLTQAQDLGLSGRMVTARELNGGAMFFTATHVLLTEPVTSRYGRSPEAFLAKAAKLGLAAESQGAGYGCQGPVLPHIAVGCVLHLEDDEFPAELTYTFDSYAHYHMPLDGIWAMINVLAEELAAE